MKTTFDEPRTKKAIKQTLRIIREAKLLLTNASSRDEWLNFWLADCPLPKCRAPHKSRLAITPDRFIRFFCTACGGRMPDLEEHLATIGIEVDSGCAIDY
jgi:hypothetical protein